MDNVEHLIRFPGLGIDLQVNEVAFTIFGMEVYWYGIIIGGGFMLALIYAYYMTGKLRINSDHFTDGVIAGMVAGILGARLYYVIFYPGDKFINNPLEIFNFREGGLGIYGGIIGALLAAVLVAKWRKMSIGAVLDVAVLGFLIGQGIGRWGNFVNQEAFGYATDLPWGMRSNMTELEFPNQNVHPCFFYESILCLLGFVLLHFFTTKMRKYDGQTFLLYLIWYGITRFFVEGLRTDSLMVPYLPIRVSQAVALLTVVAGVVVLILLRNRRVLTGCGNKAVMEECSVDLSVPLVTKKLKEDETEDDGESTIFTAPKSDDEKTQE